MKQNNLDSTKYDVKPLSKDFAHHCRNDASKCCILLPKYILQGLNVWPDNTSRWKRWLAIATIVNLGIMELAHFVFLLLNITSIPKMTSASTTVSTTFETMAKLATMIYYRDILNEILYTIWHDFWPADMASPQRRQEINFRSTYVIAVMSIFLGMAYVSSAQFMTFPLVENTNQLPLASWYPFDALSSPTYEILYIWQWFLNQVEITTLSGFDAFFNAIVMIVATQFQVLQDVLEKMCSEEGHAQWTRIFQKDGVTDDEVLVKCVQHHNKLISICKKLEQAFSHIVFIQFVTSTLAICVSAVALKADPSVWQHMLSYCVAHLLQFFIYCSVGNELTYQSEQVADAAYICDWELSDNWKLQKGLSMIILRAQRPEALTVAGLMQLSFPNFVGTVQLSFSFYTLLNSFV